MVEWYAANAIYITQTGHCIYGSRILFNVTLSAKISLSVNLIGKCLPYINKIFEHRDSTYEFFFFECELPLYLIL